MYSINVNHLPGLRSVPYRYGVGEYEGVVAHATANWEDTDEGNRSFFGRIEPGNSQPNWEVRSAYAHYFNDHNSITEFADPNYIAWGAGYTANQRFVHWELCQTKDSSKFKEAYDRYVWGLAWILFQRKLGVIDGKTLVSHKWCSDTFKDTNHQDPIAYLSYHGKTWDNLVNDVSYMYSCMEEWEKPDKQPDISLDDADKIIATISQFWFWADAQADKDEIHRQADEVRKACGEVPGYRGLSVEDADKVIWKLAQFWGWSTTQEDRDEFHRLANELRYASGQPLE